MRILLASICFCFIFSYVGDLFLISKGKDLSISKINLQEEIRYYNENNLEKGVVLYQVDDSFVLMGHSGNAINSVFGKIYKLERGDEIFFFGDLYEVNEVKKIKANDFSFLDLSNKLILVTCVWFNRRERLVVIANKK